MEGLTPQEILGAFADEGAWGDLIEKVARENNLGHVNKFYHQVTENLNANILIDVQMVEDLFDQNGYAGLGVELVEWFNLWNDRCEKMIQKFGYLCKNTPAEKMDEEIQGRLAQLQYQSGLESIASEIDTWVMNNFHSCAEGDEYAILRDILRVMKIVSDWLVREALN